MLAIQNPVDPAALDTFVGLVGVREWSARLVEIARQSALGRRAGKAVLQRHAIEIAIEKLRRTRERQPSVAELHVAQLAAEIANLPDELNTVGRSSFRSLLRQSMRDDHTLVPLFHLVRTAAMQRARGFEVSSRAFARTPPSTCSSLGPEPRRRSRATSSRPRRPAASIGAPGSVSPTG